MADNRDAVTKRANELNDEDETRMSLGQTVKDGWDKERLYLKNLGAAQREASMRKVAAEERADTGSKFKSSPKAAALKDVVAEAAPATKAKAASATSKVAPAPKKAEAAKPVAKSAAARGKPARRKRKSAPLRAGDPSELPRLGGDNVRALDRIKASRGDIPAERSLAKAEVGEREQETKSYRASDRPIKKGPGGFRRVASAVGRGLKRGAKGTGRGLRAAFSDSPKRSTAQAGKRHDYTKDWA
jgi:hypothetical protein